METVRDKLRRVTQLAGVKKITQLSPEALAHASNQAWAALARHEPQDELAALARCPFVCLLFLPGGLSRPRVDCPVSTRLPASKPRPVLSEVNTTTTIQCGVQPTAPCRLPSWCPPHIHIPSTPRCRSEVGKLGASLAALDAMLRRLVEGRGAAAGMAPAAAALCALRAACYAGSFASLQDRVGLVNVGSSMLLRSSLAVLEGLAPTDEAVRKLATKHLLAASAVFELLSAGPPDTSCQLCAAAKAAFPPAPTIKWLASLASHLARFAESGTGADPAGAGHSAGRGQRGHAIASHQSPTAAWLNWHSCRPRCRP